MTATVQRTTPLGVLVGRRDDALGVDRFGGVPYGRAARFMAAAPAAGWTGELDATGSGPAAPQSLGLSAIVPGTPPDVMGEDCLSLTVWAPSAPADAPRPVMVWIHGGSFVTGSAAQPVGSGANLAATFGAVVVALQYRLGAFGFVSFADVGGADWGSGTNLGLRDQLLGLAWVREHIGAFGGDARNVTVFGESAGGGSILHLLTSPVRGDAFDRAIVQSGSTGRTLGRDGEAVVARALLRALDLDRADPRALGSVPWEAVLRAQNAAQADPEVWQLAGLMPFHPSIDDDLVVDAPNPQLAVGVGAEIPLVLGTTRDEMQLFFDAPTMERDRLVKRVARYAGVDGERADALVAGYEALLRADGRRADPIDAWGAIFTDKEMLIPARAALDAHASHGGTTFGYRFDWTAPARPDGRPLGAAHAVDLPFALGNFDDGWGEFVGATADPAGARACATVIQRAWTRFAAVGVPDAAWPQWLADGRPTMVFDAASGVRDDPASARLALWEGIA